MAHRHDCPLHKPQQLVTLLSLIDVAGLLELRLRYDAGCEPAWTCRIEHRTLTRSAMHVLLLGLEEGAALVAFHECMETTR